MTDEIINCNSQKIGYKRGRGLGFISKSKIGYDFGLKSLSRPLLKEQKILFKA